MTAPVEQDNDGDDRPPIAPHLAPALFISLALGLGGGFVLYVGVAVVKAIVP